MRGWSITELQRIAEAEQTRTPFLCWLSQTGEQRLMVLDQSSVLTVGRRSSNNLVLLGDPEASRLHARLELIDQDWTITDDGLSRNGTFVNGARVLGRRRLKDGDWLRFGSTTVQYRAPYEGNTAVTAGGAPYPDLQTLTATQRAILTALCRQYHAGVEFPRPATNGEIAREVFLGIDAVKTHLRRLFVRFSISDLPQNQKRATLAELAVRAGSAPARPARTEA